MPYSVREAIGPYAVTLADGKVVFDAIYPSLRAGNPVEIDFSGITIFASPFFNAAFGALLKDVSGADLHRLLKIAALSPAGRAVLKRVIENATHYYYDDATRAAVDRVLEEQAAAV